MANERPAGQAARVRACLQLMRFPAVFTALADIFLGFLLTHELLAPVDQFVLLAIASSGLYLAGMVLNDLFDRHIDARERPGRPIPSGRISLPAAAALGCGLMILGPLCAAFVSLPALAIALVLVGLILAYDRFLKHVSVGPIAMGPIAMGGCRFFNVMLGASAAGTHTWEPPQLFVALAMGIYVAGVTWFARQEAAQSSRTQLAAAAAVCHVAIVGLVLIAIGMPEATAASRWTAVAALGLVTAWIDTRLVAAVREPTPRNVQAAVKQQLLAIVLLDATMVGCKTGDPVLAMAVAALLIPAATLGRWIFIT
jgi:4-hydroxybenzoate polyprenyltransferase